MRNGQAAMEFLQTYGWAIIAIAVLLVGLQYFGVFDSLSMNSCKAELGFTCVDARFERNGGAVLTRMALRPSTSDSIMIANYSLDTPGNCTFSPELGSALDQNSVTQAVCSTGSVSVQYTMTLTYKRSDGAYEHAALIHVKGKA